MSLPGLKISEGDDEFFGALESRTNLANLFGVNQQKDDSNQSLKYKPPKQVPPPTESNGSDSTAWSVQIAKVVTAFKLVNEENISQGRVGLALLKNAQNSLKIIVYRTKSNVLATTTLQVGVKLILKSSYLQFHDDSREFWSIFLETSDEQSFLDHIPQEFVSKIEAPVEEASSIPDELDQDDLEDKSFIVRDDKANLLSRMAKMGQPLPKLAVQPTPTDLSDSSDTEVIKIGPKPVLAPRKVMKQLVPVGSTSLVTYTAPQVQENQYMNMLLTENRTQNTELRMNLSKLETKIERVLDKIDSIGSRNSSQANTKDKDDEIVALEEKILELRKENRTLRQNFRELEAKKSTTAQNEKVKLRREMFSEFDDVLQRLDIHLEDCQDVEDVAMELLEKSRSRLDQLKTECQTQEKELANKQAEIERLKEENLQLKTSQKTALDNELMRCATLSRENEELRRQLESVESSSEEKLKTTIKQIMSNVFNSIAQSLEAEDDPASRQNCLRICSTAIREETLNALHGKTN